MALDCGYCHLYRCGDVVYGDGEVGPSVTGESDERRRSAPGTCPRNDYNQQPATVRLLTLSPFSPLKVKKAKGTHSS